MPKAIQAAFEKPLPQDILCGVGVAKAEADGEAIALAENRAREAIARQLTAAVNAPVQDDYFEDDYDEDYVDDFNYDDFLRDNAFENDTTAQMNDITPANDAIQTIPLPPDSFSETRTIIHVYNSEVVLREKDSKGNWWCLVWAPRNQTEPRKPVIYDEVADIIRVNATELAGMESKKDFIRNGESITAFQKGDSIPDWVFDTRSLPENMAFGLGAAKLSDNKDALQLAKERARYSLARSLDTEVISVWYTFDSYFTKPYEERNASFTSKYDHIAMPTNLIKYAKSKDGTWWVLLGCSIDKEKIPETIWEQFEEQIETYRGYQG